MNMDITSDSAFVNGFGDLAIRFRTFAASITSRTSFYPSFIHELEPSVLTISLGTILDYIPYIFFLSLFNIDLIQFTCNWEIDFRIVLDFVRL